jgi:hypothetical protein
MQLCPGVAVFPGFPLVQRAYDVARSVRSQSGPLDVGIVNGSGVLLARGVLKGYSQVSMFAELVRRAGFQELLPRTAQRLCRCDVAFLETIDGEVAMQPVLSQDILDVDGWSESVRTD